MTERLINTPCSKEDAEREIAALPDALRVFLGQEMRIVRLPVEVGYPAFTFRVEFAGREEVGAIDAALLLHMYETGGISKVQAFVAAEIAAFMRLADLAKVA